MANTMTPQPAPSIGGPGTAFMNPLVQQPKKSRSDDLLAEVRAELAKEEAAMTPEKKLERDRRQQELDQSQDPGRKR